MVWAFEPTSYTISSLSVSFASCAMSAVRKPAFTEIGTSTASTKEIIQNRERAFLLYVIASCNAAVSVAEYESCELGSISVT